MAAFIPRNWESLFAQMLGWIQSNPDLSPDFASVGSIGVLNSDLAIGSLERANLEALAVLMEDYDARALQAINYALSESAYNAFGFAPNPASAATGYVTFTAYQAPASDITIPTGFMAATTDGVQFVTTNNVTLATGALSVNAPVKAVVAGTGGNVAAGAIQRIVYPLAGVNAVSNAAATGGGQEVESDAARAARFQVWVNSLARGTASALRYAAMYVAANFGGSNSIQDALAVDQGAGVVDLFVDDGSNGGTGWGTASTPNTTAYCVNMALVGGTDSNGHTVLPWKAAGVTVNILPAVREYVYIAATVNITVNGHGRQGAIQNALTATAMAYVNAMTIGQTLSYSGLLSALTICDPDVMSIQGLVTGTTSTPAGTTDMVLDPVANPGYRWVTAYPFYQTWTLQ